MKLVFVLLVFSLCATSIKAREAAGGDVSSLNFAAFAPFTYDHKVGGGAWNDGTVGSYYDIVNSLQGGELACRDTVSFANYITIGTGFDGDMKLQVTVKFLADSTGQTGVAFSNIEGVQGNYGNVENGGGNGIGTYGIDTGMSVTNQPQAVLHDEYMTSPIFTKDSKLVVIYNVTGLRPNDRFVVRIDVRIDCLANSNPTGNLGGNLDSIYVIQTNEVKSSASGGGQNVPLQSLSDIGGIQDCYFASDAAPLVGTSFTADVEVSDPAGNGGVIYGTDFGYSWDYGAWKIAGTSTGFIELHTFETECTNDHDGEYLFSQSTCGDSTAQCEETFIGANQAQLFYELPDTTEYPTALPYYDPTLTTTVQLWVNGAYVTVTKYTANADYATLSGIQQAIHYLYLDAEGKPVRADWYDGRIMYFSNVVFITTDVDAWATAFFEEPTGCKCRRDLDIVILVDAADILKSDVGGAVKSYVSKLVSEFDMATADIALMEYDDTEVKVLRDLNGGASQAGIDGGIGLMTSSCNGGNNAVCGVGMGRVDLAIDKAVAELQANGTSSVTGVIVVVTNGWDLDYNPQIATSVSNAASLGYTVIAVVHTSYLFPEEMTSILNDNPDNLVWYWTTNQLALADPVDVSSRLCLLMTTPCGTNCCGYCDSVCGGDGCVPLDSCPINEDCRDSYELTIDGCCELRVGTPYCPPDDNLFPCQEKYCDTETGTCEVSSCSDLNNECYTYSCQTVNGVEQCVGELPPDENCRHPRCVVTGSGASATYSLVWDDHVCPADDICKTWQCVEAQGGCVATPTPTPSKNACQTLDPCDPSLDTWAPVDIVCDNSDPCVYKECSIEAGGVCLEYPQCLPDPNNACDLNTCLGSDGNGGALCSNALKECPAVACQRNGQCIPESGECEYDLLDCSNYNTTAENCRTYECSTEVDDCVVASDLECRVCTPACTNNKCQKVPCIEQECRTDLTVYTECPVNNDKCKVAGCDDTLGCTLTDVDACDPAPDACTRVVRDSTYDGCCKQVPINCQGSDKCKVYSCDLTTGCQEEFIDCTPPPCYERDESYPGSCSNGVCVFKPKVCNSGTCETHACNTTSDSCVTVSTENCNCDPSCATNQCFDAACSLDSGSPECLYTPSALSDTCVPGNASPDNSCQVFTGNCLNTTGCELEPVVCAPPADCQILRMDPSVTGCCVYEQIVCPADGERNPENLCEIYTGICLNDECLTRNQTCSQDPCMRPDPAFATWNQCDPDTGNCMYDPLSCPPSGVDGCESNVCDPSVDECVLDDDSLCFICDVPCVQNSCFNSTCINRACTEVLPTQENIDCAPLNECYTAQCTNSTGCVQTPVPPCTPPADKCYFVVRNPEFSSCCEEKPKVCTHTDLCYSDTVCNEGNCTKTGYLCDSLTTDCEVGVCTSSGCVAQPRNDILCPADASNACRNPICTVDGLCDFEDVVCTSPNWCEITDCDISSGLCISTPRDCFNGDNCTVYTCNEETDSCDEAPVECDDGNACTINSCNPNNGLCVSSNVDCNDGLRCTVDTCDPASGCVSTPDDSVCASVDPCKVTSCAPSDPNSDKLGCLTVPATCNDDSNKCTVEYCKAFEGCLETSYDCRNEFYNITVDPNASPSPDASNSEETSDVPVAGVDECDLHYCSDEDGGTCVRVPQACASLTDNTGIIVGAALGTAAVVGIVVGIVVAVALCAGGAGVYSVYKNADDGASAVVGNNPLYVESQSGGENPLFRE